MYGKKIPLIISACFLLMSTDSCKKSQLSSQQAIKNTGPFNSAAGTANFSLTPTNNGYTNMQFSLSGGTSFLPVICSYFVYNTTTFQLLSNLYITQFLDANGNTEINLTKVLCSNGNTTAYVTWNCTSALYPFFPALAVNIGGNAFYFTCPMV